MDNFPSSYEQFLKLDTTVSKNVTEAQFYKEGYLSIIVLMESSMQKLHTLESKNKSLVEENQRLEDEIDKYNIEEAGSAELQIGQLKTNIKKLNNSIENKVSENDYLKVTITKLEEESLKMATINKIEQLLDTKLAKLKNSIVKGLNSTVVTSDKSQQQKSPIAIEKHRNAVTPGLQSSEDFSSSPNLLSSAAPSFPVKSFNKERTDLQKRQCTEWWCPVHSDFGLLVKKLRPISANDQVLIQRAKSRFAYWTRGNMVRCCTLDRKRQTQPTTYELPSCWPTVLESDVDELSNAFSKF